MSLAEDARSAARSRPFLLEALRAGVVNYAAAARVLGVSDDTEAVAAALRRFAGTLDERDPTERDARITMHGLETAEDDPLLSVSGTGFGVGDGPYTGIVATGEVDPGALGHALALLDAHGHSTVAAGAAGGAMVLVVERRASAGALRLVEEALGAVPNPTV